MFDKDLIKEILNQILESSHTILVRFKPIKEVSDFTSSPEGKEKLDAICMQLITVGESLKNIDKITDKKLLVKYPEVDWRGAMAMRDIITHHYFDIDAEVVFEVCKNKIQPLSTTIDSIIKDLEGEE